MNAHVKNQTAVSAPRPRPRFDPVFDVPPLTLMAHLHGLLATMWLMLHYTQARLIAAHRVELHKRLGINGSTRASFYLYNTVEEVERLGTALEEVQRQMRRKSSK